MLGALNEPWVKPLVSSLRLSELSRGSLITHEFYLYRQQIIHRSYLSRYFCRNKGTCVAISAIDVCHILSVQTVCMLFRIFFHQCLLRHIVQRWQIIKLWAAVKFGCQQCQLLVFGQSCWLQLLNCSNDLRFSGWMTKYRELFTWYYDLLTLATDFSSFINTVVMMSIWLQIHHIGLIQKLHFGWPLRCLLFVMPIIT